MPLSYTPQTTSTIENLYSSVLPSVRGCPHVTALGAIQAAATEFCRRTLIWRTALPAVSSVLAPLTFTAPLVAATTGTLTAAFSGPTRTDYVLTFSDGSFQMVTLNNGSTAVTWLNPVTATVSATYSQVAYTIPPTTDASVAKILRFTVDGIEKDVVNTDRGEYITLHRDSPNVAWTVDRVNFNVSPPPVIAGMQYGLVVALQPTQTAMTLPSLIIDNYAEEIAYGALYRLERMNSREWSNDDDAARNKADFERRIAVISNQVAKGYARGRMRSKAHTF